MHQSSLIEVRTCGYDARVAQTEVSRESVDPPRFLQLAAHPVRWRLLRELVHSDRAVSELMELLDEPQSLVSYHLRQLRGGELVSRRRSSADRRDSYYSVDLTRCTELLQGAGGALHPALRLTPGSPGMPSSTGRSHRRPRILFLCTGNSARSQIAEALLQRLSKGKVEASSAGSHPKPLHPNAVRVMRKQGIDISRRRTKHLSEFLAQQFDFVITLCDKVREICPEFPAHPDLVHWSIPDPALEGRTDRANYPAFGRTASELETRIHFLLSVINEPLPTTRRYAHA
jgi:ArsR family transcriptional regulator, arsenate/arsenite/antimonite-responsive transcriptional repressor / arsenate reductase (thioredoxin)